MTKKELNNLAKELKIGEYIRTKKGRIFKLKKINGDYLIEDKEYGAMGCFIDDMVKHSSNIIDLIEEGDYVNGYKVLNVINEEPCPSGKCVDIESNMDSSYCTFWDNDIVDIVTKEQFEERKFYV